MKRGVLLAGVFVLIFSIFLLGFVSAATDAGCSCGCQDGWSFAKWVVLGAGNFCDLSGPSCLKSDWYNRYYPAFKYCNSTRNGLRIMYGSLDIYDVCSQTAYYSVIGCTGGQSCCGGKCYDSNKQFCCEDLSGQICDYIFDANSGMNIGRQSCIDSDRNGTSDSCEVISSTCTTSDPCKKCGTASTKRVLIPYDFNSINILPYSYFEDRANSYSITNEPDGKGCVINTKPGTCQSGICVPKPEEKPCPDKKSGSITKSSKPFPADQELTKSEFQNKTETIQSDIINELFKRGFLNDGDGFVCPSDRCVRKKFFNGDFWPWSDLGVLASDGTSLIRKILKPDIKNIEGDDDPNIKLPLSKSGRLDKLPPTGFPVVSSEGNREEEYKRLKGEVDKILEPRASDWFKELQRQYNSKLDSYKVIHDSALTYNFKPYTYDFGKVVVEVTSADYKLELVKNKEKQIVITLDYSKICEDRT